MLINTKRRLIVQDVTYNKWKLTEVPRKFREVIFKLWGKVVMPLWKCDESSRLQWYKEHVHKILNTNTRSSNTPWSQSWTLNWEWIMSLLLRAWEGLGKMTLTSSWRTGCNGERRGGLFEQEELRVMAEQCDCSVGCVR